MFSGKIRHEYARIYLKKHTTVVLIYSKINAVLFVLQFSAPMLSIIIEDYLIVQCRVIYEFFILSYDWNQNQQLKMKEKQKHTTVLSPRVVYILVASLLL